MKKFILLLLAVLIGSATASAQVVESRMGGVYIEKGPSPENRWFLKLGGGLTSQDARGRYYGNSLTFDDGNYTISGTAFDLSLGFNRDFKYGSSWYWGIRLGAGYSTSYKIEAGKGTVDDYPDELPCTWDKQSLDYNQMCIHVGPTFGFRKGIGANMKLDINFSPEAVRVSGHSSLSTLECQLEYPRETTGTYETDFESLSGFAASGTLGVDLWIKKFIVGVNYRYIYDLEYYTNQAIMLNVGIAF